MKKRTNIRACKGDPSELHTRQTVLFLFLAPKRTAPYLKRKKNAQLKGFVFNPLVLGQVVGEEIANSSWAKHLIPSCGRQIKPQFYWATSRCECEHGAGRFLLLLEPALTQTL